MEIPVAIQFELFIGVLLIPDQRVRVVGAAGFPYISSSTKLKEGARAVRNLRLTTIRYHNLPAYRSRWLVPIYTCI